MALNVSVGGGTRAGIRAPYTEGHSPKCVCSKCERARAWDPRPAGALCDYCVPFMDAEEAKPATVYCRGCKRNLCDLCCECH